MRWGSAVDLTGWFVVAGLIVAYGVILFWLVRTGRVGPDRALSLFGPALMTKTQRGRAALDRLGRFRRFWSVVADLGLWLSAAAMVVIVGLLVLDAIIASSVPPSAAPTPAEALGLPGINPIIPLGYGLVALIIAVIFHELSHGVIARSQQIGVKSIGVLWLVIPVGAFVEQDEASFQKAGRRARGRVLAGGILANFALTAVFFALLAAMVSTSVTPAASGVGIVGVIDGTPAQNASLAAGDILASVNGTTLSSNTDLYSALSATHPGQNVTLSWYSPSSSGLRSASVTLTSVETYTHQTADANRSFLGISLSFLTPTQLKEAWVAPWASPAGPQVGLTEWLLLPLAGLEPVGAGTAGFFHVSGPFGAFGAGGFWIGANVLYWLAWMNLLLGLSNALPLIPLDGGTLFRDGFAGLVHRLRRSLSADELDRWGGRAAAVSSVAVLVLIVWQFIAPRL